jgi:hypothetical protein
MKEQEEAMLPSRVEIAKRAYELYAERGYEDGHAQEDWLAAEAAVMDEYQKSIAQESEEPPVRPKRSSVAA